EMALRQFVARMMSEKIDARIAVPESALLRAVTILDDDPKVEDGAAAFDVFHLAGEAPHATLETLRAACPSRAIPSDEKKIPLVLPRGAGEPVEAPLSARVVARVHHWVHLLRLSQLSVGVTLIDRLRKRPGLALRLKLIRDPWARARKISFVDP